MVCKFKPAIWSPYNDQRIPYFDRCQLITAWMSIIKEVHRKPRLYVSVNLFLRRRRRRAYAPTSNTASHDTHEKIKMSMGLYLAGAPLIFNPARGQLRNMFEGSWRSFGGKKCSDLEYLSLDIL